MSDAIQWEEHQDDNITGQDMMTACGRFEAIMDDVYGYYSVRRSGFEMSKEEEKIDDVLGEFHNLSQAEPLILAHIQKYC